MIHTYTINVLCQITFEYNDRKTGFIPATNLDDACDTAINLAIQPNFHTIENGCALLEVRATHAQNTRIFNRD